LLAFEVAVIANGFDQTFRAGLMAYYAMEEGSGILVRITPHCVY
jgi:preprotein translocase subunit Sec61beta